MARKGRPPAAHCDAIVAGWKLVGEDPFYRGLLGMADPLATLANPTAETFAGTGWAQVRVGGNPLRGWGGGRAAVDPRTAILANARRPGTPAARAARGATPTRWRSGPAPGS